MGLSISEIRKNTTRARHLMQRTRAQRFAVGAFNIDNQETLIAVARAAQKLQSPVLVEVSDAEVKAMGLENVRDLVDNYKAEYGIEMYLNLDHGPTVEGCKRAIDAGYEFIHIDISQANHDASDEEIIAKTREVVEYAKFTGALVESEPHYFGGSSNVHTEDINYEEIKKTFSTPDGARAFVEATGIDGGSGTPLHYFEDAAKIGVSKININSDMRYAFRTTLEKTLRENPNEYAIVKLMPPVYAAVQEVVESKIKAFNSVRKAVV